MGVCGVNEGLVLSRWSYRNACLCLRDNRWEEEEQ